MNTHDPNNSESLTRRTLRLLERQRDALRQVGELARAQRNLIEREDTDGLLALMTQRQTALQEATSAGEELLAMRSATAQVDDAHSAEIERLRDEVSALVQEISTLDEEDRRTLERKRERVLEEMSGVSRAREAAAAYGSRESGARYQDREG
ncbi:MAG: flagellar export chaperone FlgN [Phycisphaerales bacterium]